MKIITSSKSLYFLVFVLLLSIICSFPKPSSAQTSDFIEWQRCLGGAGTEYPGNVVATTDGGYVICGSTLSSDGDLQGIAHPPCGWVVKLDQGGTIIWSTCVDAESNKFITSIIQTSDGGYILCGYTGKSYSGVLGYHGGTSDAWVAKLRSDGSLDWQKLYGGSSSETAYSICENNIEGGGYVFAGVTRSNDGDVSGLHIATTGGDSTDIWVVKLSLSGDIEWQHCYGGENRDWAKSIVQTSDKGYAFVGWTASHSGDVTNHFFSDTLNSSDAWVVKINSSGRLLWERCFGGSRNDQGYSVASTSDGGVVLAGITTSNDGNIPGFHLSFLGSSDAFIARLSATGEIIWQKCYGGTSSENANSIVTTTDGGYLLLGSSSSYDGDLSGIPYHGHIGPAANDFWLLKVGSDGIIEWQKCFGGAKEDIGYSAVITKDNKIVCIGSTTSLDGDVVGIHDGIDIWAVKLGVLSGVAPSFDDGYTDLIRDKFLKIYPNPSSSSVHLELLPWFTAQGVELYNLLGTKLITETTVSQNSATVNTKALPNGTYIARISYSTEKSNGVFTLPFIVYH